MIRRKYSDEEVIKEAREMLSIVASNSPATCEKMAAILNIPRSTFWWHMSCRLREIDPEYHEQVNRILKRGKKR